MIDNTRLLARLDGPWEMIVPRRPPPAAEPPHERIPTDLADSGVYEIRRVVVPTTWEREGVPKPYPGPVWFRRTFPTPVFEPGERVYLRFRAVSAVAVVWLNGVRLGLHRGIWDAFELDATEALRAAGDNVLVVEVHKPGGYYPVQSSLSGFIPYVTTTFGGIWQGVEIAAVPAARIHDLWIRTHAAEGRVVVSGEVEDATAHELVVSTEGHSRTVALGERERSFHVEIPVAGLQPWSPESPALYTLTAGLRDRRGRAVGPEAVVRYGLRDVTPELTRVHLNGGPRYLRGALHWCAYTDLYSPTPERGRIEHEMRSLRELGYNLIKLCLLVPHDLYFQVADELGMLLWLELPLWMPRMDDGFAERARTEYTRIVRGVRNHPSVVVWTLGCELDRAVDEATLRDLYRLVREESGSSLVRDNSGSPECYGGVAEEFADFHDYHFYSEAHNFQDLMDHFVPHWKERKPLLFGEYCDCDTFRSIADLFGDTDPWWSVADPVLNPQGVRWDYNITSSRARMASVPPPVSVAEMKRRSYAKALEYRKDILEQTRRRADTSGYVVTNIQDTPLSTSGMLDDRGEHKFPPTVFRAFNADTVLAAEVERRRVWKNGGDRPVYLDEWCLAAPGRLRRRIIVSHFGPRRGEARLEWSLSVDGRAADRGVFPDLALEPGELLLAGTADATIGAAERPGVALLTASLLTPEGVVARGEWSYWVLPEAPALERGLDLWDPRGALADLSKVAGPVRRIDAVSDSRAGLLVATVFHPELRAARERGVALLLLLDGAEGDVLEPCPFFREAIPVVLESPLVDPLPHGGYGGIQWKGVAPDRALKPAVLGEALGAPLEQVIARYDARTFVTTSYLAASSGPGPAVVATTLRLAGGVGRQPAGLENNHLGRHLARTMLSYLARGS